MKNTNIVSKLKASDPKCLAPWDLLLKWLLPCTLLPLLTGCIEEAVAPSVNATHVVNDLRQSAICFTSLDRTIPPLITQGVTLEPAGRIFAGFETLYTAGAEPFACNRLHRSRGQGLFLFDLSSLRKEHGSESYRAAILEISSFEPHGEIHITEATPWGLGFGEGWIGGSATLTSCGFKVKAITDNWRLVTPSSSSLVATRELARPRNATFVVPMTRPVSMDVSAEIRELWNRGSVGGEIFGFSIESVGIGMDFSSSNRCAGFFTVRLRTFLETD